ncbi:MAG: molecular chaperone HscC [Clostridiales Family XIII bacterium]|jgi:molecular chaperone HscC|nr:molecular chaperone HscC [Clostridiales Family XIII bacterium]
MPIIGIDLGTTNSLVSCMTPDGPVVIPNSFGDHLTPSVVSVLADGEILTGKIAAERRFTDPLNTASVFKRGMGTKKEYKLGGRVFLPEELSSFIVKKLKEDAEVFLGEPVAEAVISCPAYFGEAQRRATKTAGELAGLKVERIVSEPTAAAIAYGLHERGGSSKFLIFDLGGGTFDVSILEYSGSIMEVRAVAGDNYLGGEDFTSVLEALFLARFKLKEAALAPLERAALYKAAEAAKRAFSKERTFTMRVTVGGEPMEAAFAAAEFEDYCEPLLTRLKTPVIRTLSDASLRASDIDAVVLVGGAAKMPVIRNFVGKLFGLIPSSTIDPDEAVAIGAGIQAAMKERNETVRELLLTDVCSYTLGIETAHRQPSGLIRSGLYSPIIERNTVIPASRAEKFYTMHDGQEQIDVKIYQGESRNTRDNVFLGNLEISVPPRPAGEECVEVRFTYDINGILEAIVTAGSTGDLHSIVIEKNPGAMSEGEIRESLEALKALKIHPRDKDEYRFLLEKGERLYVEQTGERRQFVAEALASFEETLERQDWAEIETAAAKLREIFEELEHTDESF